MWNQPPQPLRHYSGQAAQDLSGMTQIVGRQLTGKEFVNIVGAGRQHPSQRAPAQGGTVTAAHQRLYQTGLFNAHQIARMPAHGAAIGLALVQRGATVPQVLSASGALHGAGNVTSGQAPAQRVGQAMNGNGGPYEVPMVGNGPREFPMGFGITPVAMGANVIINAQPQVNFRPSRLVIPDSIAPSFMINDFKIGMRSQLVAPGSIPAQSFTQTAVGTAMALDTVNVGQFTTLDVTNVASQTVNFAASLFGTTLNS
jgi:hypothetical protein